MWGVSVFREIGFYDGWSGTNAEYVECRLAAGAIWFVRISNPRVVARGWDVEWFCHPADSGRVSWRPYLQISSASRAGNRYAEGCVPLWLPALLIAAPSAWLWWRDRQRWGLGPAGRCAACGYDLTGLPAGAACPECGR